MSIKETNEKFYTELIDHFKSIGDTEGAKNAEEHYKRLKAQTKNLDKDNKRIIDELTK
uniref:hypothetical protein n=1 Tax=Bacillus multifaciens TaxID=3068506 RepID=UPI003F49616A